MNLVSSSVPLKYYVEKDNRSQKIVLEFIHTNCLRNHFNMSNQSFLFPNGPETN